MNVKLFLRPDESEEQGEELIIKALSAKHNGDLHSEQFPDPGINHVAESVKKKHQDLMAELLDEIIQIVES